MIKHITQQIILQQIHCNLISAALYHNQFNIYNKNTVTGGEIGATGNDAIICLNSNAVFTYGIRTIQEIQEIVTQ